MQTRHSSTKIPLLRFLSHDWRVCLLVILVEVINYKNIDSITGDCTITTCGTEGAFVVDYFGKVCSFLILACGYTFNERFEFGVSKQRLVLW